MSLATLVPIFKKNNYFYEEAAFFILDKLFDNFKNDKLTDNFFDIGSRYGYYSNFIAKKKLITKVNSFDPLREYFFIQKISQKINSSKNIIVNDFGLSNKNEEIIIKNNYKIKLLKLDTFVGENKITPSILKIDVDGYEGKVLLGSVNSMKNIEFILLELHVNSIIEQYSSMNRIKVLSLLLEHGFYLFCVSPYRFNKDISDIEYYRKNKKIKLFELNNSNLKSFLFNRNQNDELILCVKDKSIISKMNIF